MPKTFFWSDWEPPYKYLFSACLLVLVSAMGLAIIQNQLGLDQLVEIKTDFEIENIDIEADQLTNHLYELPITIKNYLISQFLVPGEFHLNKTSAYIFLILSCFAAILMLTVATIVRKMGVFITLAVAFILWLLFLRFDFIKVWGLSNNLFLGIVGFSYLIPAYIFKAYLPNTNILIRFIFFTCITIIHGFLISQYAIVETPLIGMAHFGIIFPVIVTLLLLVLVSHDIVSSFLILISGTTSRTPNNLIKYFIFALLYLGNLLVYFLHKTKVIDFQLVIFNPFVLFGISVLVGIWGIRNRSNMWSKTLLFEGAGAFLYLSMAIFSFATLYFSFVIGNSAMTELFETLIIFSHLAFGIAFFAYSLQNFIELLIKNIPLRSIIYQPQGMPYWIVYVSGFFLLTIFIAKNNQKHWSNFVAGYHYNQGIGYFFNNEENKAQSHFNATFHRDLGNPTAGYILANYAERDRNIDKALDYYHKINLLKPHPFSVLGEASLMNKNDYTIRAFFALKDGLEKYPNDINLNLTLAHQYYKLGQIDSCVQQYEKILTIAPENAVVSSNMMAMSVKHHLIDQKELPTLNFEIHENDPIYQTNLLALNNSYHTYTNPKLNTKFIQDSIPPVAHICYLNNFVSSTLKNPHREVTKQLSEYSKRFKDENPSILYPLSIAYSYVNEVAKSKEQFDNLIRISEGYLKAHYEHLAGRLMAKHKLKEIATSYYESSIATQNGLFVNDAMLSASLLLSNLEYHTLAKHYLKTILQNDSTRKNVAKKLLDLSNISSIAQFRSLSDYDKALCAIVSPFPYKQPIQSLTDFSNDTLKATCVSIFIEKALKDSSELSLAKKIIEQLPEIYPTKIQSSMNYYLTQYYLLTNQLPVAKNILKSGKSILNRTYIKALLAYYEKDYQKTERLLTIALNNNPFHAATVKLASTYYFDTKKNEDKGYEIVQFAVSENPNSIPINIEFIERCVQLEYYKFATSAMRDLQSLMNEKEFTHLLNRIGRKAPQVKKEILNPSL